MKDTKRLKNIFLQIDIMLVVLLTVVGILYVQERQKYQQFEMLNYRTRMETLQLQQTLVQGKIDEINQKADKIRPQLEQEAETLQQQLEQEQSQLKKALELEQQTSEKLELERQFQEMPANDEGKLTAIRADYAAAIRQLEDKILAGESDHKICYLTFDDGPTYLTSEFLAMLEKYDARATFFTIGNLTDEMRADLMQQEALAGHSIQNHTYSHGFDTGLYDSVESFMTQVKKQGDFIYEATGIHSDVVRFPAGSYYSGEIRESCIAALDKAGYGWIDWCGNAFDTGDNLPTADTTAKTVLSQARQEDIYLVLMHDWNENTLAALDEIIPTLQEEGYLFLPLFRDSVTVGTAYPKWD